MLQRNAFAGAKEAADFTSYMTYADYRPAQVVTDAVAAANGTLRIRTNHTVVTAKTFDPLAAPDLRLVVKFTIKSWGGKQVGDPVEFSVVLANRDRMDQAEKAGAPFGLFWVLRSSGAWQNGSYRKAAPGYGVQGKLNGGPVRVGDTVELRTGTADSFTSGLTLRVGNRATVLASSSGANARPLAVGFSGMEGAAISDFSVTAP